MTKLIKLALSWIITSWHTSNFNTGMTTECGGIKHGNRISNPPLWISRYQSVRYKQTIKKKSMYTFATTQNTSHTLNEMKTTFNIDKTKVGSVNVVVVCRLAASLPLVHNVLWKFTSWLTTCTSQHVNSNCKWTVEISTFIATI